MTAPVRRRAEILAFGLALAAAGAVGAGAQEPFSHETHDPLFPLCEGCHEVGPAGATLYPPPELCGRCHDGDQAPTVAWSTPAVETAYEHPVHGPETGVELSCTDCHGAAGGVRLAVSSDACASCHVEHHGESARCRLCHSPSPRPDHEAAAHAGCAGAGCHAAEQVEDVRFDRELCLLCHPDRAEHRPGRTCGRCHAVGQPAG
ncbi:MAG: hypothetical protein GWM90_14180 [Gemmatimonadetes bacterium]|nr:hypothetical protein [Gemmatimonadota bacterium]NIQ55295.1 hypothetical protein [Gemmatimonadota bacterium]NIU75495.1 hypothetical protein [Gammaproteobacteria bacterium]NIX45216.1 hypothetical protein [Gemmatimonadota bacterium]NIY09473.1 hypothetical protein [Gemmatimonadota bacterium]